MSLWDPVLNCFILRQGFMSATLADITFLTSLSPYGDDDQELRVFSTVQGAEDLYTRSHKLLKTIMCDRSKIGFNALISHFSSSSRKVSQEEEVIFILFVLTHFMMCKSGSISTLFLPLAVNISFIKSFLAIGPIMLGQLYGCLYRCRRAVMDVGDLNHIGGPLWLLTCWGSLYTDLGFEMSQDELIAKLQ